MYRIKICTNCLVPKHFNDFYSSNKTKDGLCSWCKKCKNALRKNDYMKRPWTKTLKKIRERCANSNHDSYKYYGGKGIKCQLTLEDIKELWFRDKAYLMKKPSIDRFNNNKNYTFNNCQFIEHKENSRKQIHYHRKINQYNLEGKFIKEWKSIKEASQTLKINNISNCCNGKYQQAGGYKWSYVSE